MSSLLEALSSTFNSDAVGGLAKALGTDSSSVTKGLGALGPLLLGGMAKAAGTPAGASALFDQLPKDSGGILGGMGNLGSLVSGMLGGGAPSAGSGLVQQLFGGGANAIGASLSRALGFNISPLLGIVAPVLMGAVAKVAKAQNLDAGGVASLLAKEQSTFAADPANAATLGLVRAATEAGTQASAVVNAYGSEWANVALGPVAATLLVATSDLSGPFDTMKEIKAANEVILTAATTAASASVLASAFGGGLTPDQLKQVRDKAPGKDQLLALIVAGARSVAARSPAEAVAYKSTILKVAQATAEAAKDGGFLGIGGTLVSKDEQAAIDALKAALG